MIKLDKIMFPADFSETSAHAMKYALAMAREFKTKLLVCHVIDVEHEYFAYSPGERLEKDLKHHAEREMEKFLPTDVLGGIECERIIAFGTPFVEIVRTARDRDVDMIVMGTHGKRALNHALFGSTAEKVVRKAPCPVLTVKHPEHEFVLP